MFCDCEYPASLPPNVSASVAPPGPVRTEGRVKVSWPCVPCGPWIMNCPLFAASVRDTTVGTPGSSVPKLKDWTPVTAIGRCPKTGVATTTVSAKVYQRVLIARALV